MTVHVLKKKLKTQTIQKVNDINNLNREEFLK